MPRQKLPGSYTLLIYLSAIGMGVERDSIAVAEVNPAGSKKANERRRSVM